MKEIEIEIEIFAEQLQTNIMQSIASKSLDELKQIDWFSWNTEFFIEKEKTNKAA